MTSIRFTGTATATTSDQELATGGYTYIYATNSGAVDLYLSPTDSESSSRVIVAAGTSRYIPLNDNRAKVLHYSCASSTCAFIVECYE